MCPFRQPSVIAKMGAMETESVARRRLSAVMREGERVKPLELFFDLVFVLAITQCTALMVEHPTWEGVGQGMLVLGLLWWSWVAYSWLTSVVDPEEGAVRLSMFAAMAALLVVGLSVPETFDERATWFAVAYAAVRTGHIALYLLASRDNAALRQSVMGLAGSTAIGAGLLVGGSFLEGAGQGAVWTLALILDMAGPYFFGSEGWTLVPGHFAERHGLIIIVALGESVVALGIGAEVGLSLGVAVAAVLGIALVSELWWIYFDVVALVSAQRLARAAEGRERNELARDAYSYLHFPMVAGIVLAALGLEQTLAHVEDPLHTVPAFAFLGGVALYLLGHIALRLRNVHTLNRQRLALAILLFALVPLATELPALATLGLVVALLCALIVYETARYGESRTRLRLADAVGQTQP
jgi:low temperature requirement protein LtrA